MKPVDIKGRPIYSRIFSILLKHGSKLLEAGWKESYNKPNLFRKEFQGQMIFADMRGTEIISIWDEPYPYLYVFGEGEEEWKIRRSMRLAVEELDTLGVPHRFSFYDEMEPDGLFFGYEDELADGKCKICGSEFDKDGLFCSENCEKTHSQRQQQIQDEIKEKLSKAKKPDSASDKPKVNNKEKKKRKGEKRVSNGLSKQTYPDSFDSPSEKFKKAQQRRDKAKHPRY